MIVNFKAREISQNTRKLTRTPTLILKKKIETCLYFNSCSPRGEKNKFLGTPLLSSKQSTNIPSSSRFYTTISFF